MFLLPLQNMCIREACKYFAIFKKRNFWHILQRKFFREENVYNEGKIRPLQIQE